MSRTTQAAFPAAVGAVLIMEAAWAALLSPHGQSGALTTMFAALGAELICLGVLTLWRPALRQKWVNPFRDSGRMRVLGILHLMFAVIAIVAAVVGITAA